MLTYVTCAGTQVVRMFSDLKNKIELMSTGENVDISIVKQVLDLVKDGKIRVAEKRNGQWVVNTWVKQAVLLAFKYSPAKPQVYDAFDKFGLLPYEGGYRKVPGAIIRNYVHISEGAVIMPSCINIGAYIGTNTMIDINVAIGSCAQIGNNCHISAMACIGGVLEPSVAMPTIIEDNCFIGAQSAILEGVIVEENSVIATGTIITASTKIIERDSGKVTYGVVSSGSVVVPGSYQTSACNINCAVIVKRITSEILKKTSINELLRDANIGNVCKK